MTIVGVLYVAYDGYDTDSRDAEILFTTENEHEARAYAQRHNAVVYRYDVTNDENYTSHSLYRLFIF